MNPSPVKKVKRAPAKSKATTANKKKSPVKKVRQPKKTSNAPKRPLTSFIMYMSDNRADILNKNPGIAFTDISKIGAQQWKKLKQSEKDKYIKAAEADKERYKKEKENYVPDPEEKKRNKRKKKDPNEPLRARTSYIYYVKSRLDKARKEHPDYKMREIMTLMGSEWKALSEKEKKPYKDMAAKDKVRHANEKSAMTKD